MVLPTLIGLAFVTIYPARVHWSIAPAYLLTVPLLGSLSSLLSRRVKTVQKRIVTETTALAGSTTESLRNIELVKSLGLAQQEIDRLNSTTDKILKLELEKVRYPQPEFCSRQLRQSPADFHSPSDALPDLHATHHRRAVFLSFHLFIFHFWPAAGTGQCRQRVSRDGSIARQFRRDFENADGAKAREPGRAAFTRNTEVRPS